MCDHHETNLVYFQMMEYGRSPVTPSHRRCGLAFGPKTPQTRQRNRSGSNVNSPSGMSRVNTSSTATPRRELSCLVSPPSTSSQGLDDSLDSPDERAIQVFSKVTLSSTHSLVEQVGEGTFSTVYLAEAKVPGHRKLALKHLVPTSKPSRILMEAECMRAAGGHHNVIQLLGMWRVAGDVILAMPHIDHCKFIDLVASISLEEVKFYIANLLSALAHIHNLGIIHRDIKPSNFLYDRRRKQFALVDFGLAQFDKEISGVKRKMEDEQSQSDFLSNKKPRTPLTEADSKLNRKSPRTRLVKEVRSPVVRRSPRKLSIGMSPIVVDNLDSVVSLTSFPNNLGSTQEKPNIFSKTPTKTPPVRCSPRKNLAQIRKPITAVKITNNSIISPDLSTPSPSSTLTRHPSFSMLDVSGQSQLTEFSGVTGLLRASLTSHCSSALMPRQESSRPRLGVTVSCSCPGQMSVCSSCLSLPHLHAARAGTPGFRPPEVLLKSHSQSVAVDMWAVGVILLSLLSR